MSIPTPSQIEPYMLRLISQGSYYSAGELREPLADEFSLTPKERCQTFPNGIDVIFTHYCCKAQTNLKKKGLIQYERGTLRKITPAGRRTFNLTRSTMARAKEAPVH